MNKITLDEFHHEVQETVGILLQLRPEDKQVLFWLYHQPTSVYLYIKKNCPFRMPRDWREWYENGVMPI